MTQKLVTLATSVWIAVRFIFFAVGGLWLLILSGGSLYMRLAEHIQPVIHPALCVLLLEAACCSILYGIGKWGQWLYLLVLGSCPFVFITFVLGMAWLFPFADMGFQFLWMIVAILASLAGLWPVGSYYKRLDAREGHISPVPDSLSLPSPDAPKP